MESPSFMSWMPCAQTLRNGQRRVLVSIERDSPRHLNVRLPTGYGKTLTAAAAYAVQKRKGVTNRLLYIVPTIAQLRQLVEDQGGDFREAGVDGPTVPNSLGYSATQALNNHRNNRCQIFGTTIQAICQNGRAATEAVSELLHSGSWMIVIDEYHHYGQEKSWTRAIADLPCVFRLAMSATPYRKDGDEAFGKPDIEVSYREAVDEGVVKALECHSYVYQIDAVTTEGLVQSFTTKDLIDEAGSTSPEAIEKLKIERKMRWSPKYVSPLIYNPFDRLERTRIATGLNCQALVGAMCCSHAQLVCDQIKTMYPDLRVDWVGTGPNGRPDETNREIIKAFCPPKRDFGRQSSDVGLDVLVHVGMAGEGLDSVFVTEVVHLNPANINNQNNQENGRAARLLPDTNRSHQIGYVSVDACSEYAEYTGPRIMNAMDDELPGELSEEDAEDLDRGDRTPLPEDPEIRIIDVRCIRIDRGEVERMATVLVKMVDGWSPADLEDPSHPVHAFAEKEYRGLRMREAEANNENAINAQWRDQVNRAVNAVVNRAARMLTAKNARFEKSLIGDLKKRVQQERSKVFSSYKNSDVEDLQRQYRWLVKVEQEMIASGLPAWLR